jgi:membrane-associated phospholipid phosphatase
MVAFEASFTNEEDLEVLRDGTASAAPSIETKISATIQIWWKCCLLGVASIVASVLYLDRPISLLSDKIFSHIWSGSNFIDAPGFFRPLALLLFSAFLLRRVMRWPFGKPDLACLLADVSVLLADFVTGELKHVFGRVWPKYGHPSFVRDHVYGFYPFHSGHAYESFPSGHIASISAVFFVLWIFYPQFRAFYFLTVIGLSVALIAMNYHFLSDTIAGALVGGSTAVVCVCAWQLYRNYLSRVAGI